MSYIIAITGKGGVGKTTVAALTVRQLIASGRHPVLAVDADPNACLDELLGVRATTSIGRVREEAREAAGAGMSAGVSKQQLIELKIAESLVEADDFDLIAMGRPEGPGCYCYANNVLKSALEQIADSYPFVVIDNEAGLENLSRRLVQSADLLVIVADPSKRGLDTARRLHELAGEMKIEYRRLALVVNRVKPNEDASLASKVAEDIAASDVILLPEDDELAEIARRGESIDKLSENNPVLVQAGKLICNHVAIKSTE